MSASHPKELDFKSVPTSSIKEKKALELVQKGREEMQRNPPNVFRALYYAEKAYKKAPKFLPSVTFLASCLNDIFTKIESIKNPRHEPRSTVEKVLSKLCKEEILDTVIKDPSPKNLQEFISYFKRCLSTVEFNYPKNKNLQGQAWKKLDTIYNNFEKRKVAHQRILDSLNLTINTSSAQLAPARIGRLADDSKSTPVKFESVSASTSSMSAAVIETSTPPSTFARFEELIHDSKWTQATFEPASVSALSISAATTATSTTPIISNITIPSLFPVVGIQRTEFVQIDNAHFSPLSKNSTDIKPASADEEKALIAEAKKLSEMITNDPLTFKHYLDCKNLRERAKTKKIEIDEHLLPDSFAKPISQKYIEIVSWLAPSLHKKDQKDPENTLRIFGTTFFKALQCLVRGKPNDVLNCFNNVCEKEIRDKDPLLNYMIAHTHQLELNLVKAIQFYEKAMANTAANQILFLQAGFHFAVLLDKTIPADPRCIEMFSRLHMTFTYCPGTFFTHIHDYSFFKEQIETFRAKHSPKDLVSNSAQDLLLAESKLDQGNFNDAINACSLLILQSPFHAEAILLRVKAYLETERYYDAYRDLVCLSFKLDEFATKFKIDFTFLQILIFEKLKDEKNKTIALNNLALYVAIDMMEKTKGQTQIGNDRKLDATSTPKMGASALTTAGSASEERPPSGFEVTPYKPKKLFKAKPRKRKDEIDKLLERPEVVELQQQSNSTATTSTASMSVMSDLPPPGSYKTFNLLEIAAAYKQTRKERLIKALEKRERHKKAEAEKARIAEKLAADQKAAAEAENARRIIAEKLAADQKAAAEAEKARIAEKLAADQKAAALQPSHLTEEKIVTSLTANRLEEKVFANTARTRVTERHQALAEVKAVSTADHHIHHARMLDLTPLQNHVLLPPDLKHEIIRKLFSKKRLIPRVFERVLQTLYSNDKEVFIKGGFLRNNFLNRLHPKLNLPTHDLDCFTTERQDKSITAIKEIALQDDLQLKPSRYNFGKNLKYFKITSHQSKNIDVITDVNFSEFCKPEDLTDFTVNLPIYDPSLNKCVMGGIEEVDTTLHDLYYRTVRSVKIRVNENDTKLIFNPKLSFERDPIKMLRAINLCTLMKGNIETETSKAIKANAHLFSCDRSKNSNAFFRRMNIQLKKMFMNGQGYENFQLLLNYGIAQHMFPNLSAKDKSQLLSVLDEIDSLVNNNVHGGYIPSYRKVFASLMIASKKKTFSNRTNAYVHDCWNQSLENGYFYAELTYPGGQEKYIRQFHKVAKKRINPNPLPTIIEDPHPLALPRPNGEDFKNYQPRLFTTNRPANNTATASTPPQTCGISQPPQPPPIVHSASPTI